MTIRLVKQKINKIEYDYDIIYEKIEQIMQEDNIIDLGEKKLNIFGLFSISIDFIPDIIERKTVVSVIVAILEEIKFIEISNKKFRLKLDLKPLNQNKITKNNKTRLDNELLIEFIKNLYDDKIETKLKNLEFDDKIFAYTALIILSIMEDSTIVILGHQLSMECIPLEEGLEESTSSNILIDKILKSIK